MQWHVENVGSRTQTQREPRIVLKTLLSASEDHAE
jgi:hypothetical protein